MSIIYITGDLLDQETIAHQCNCVSSSGKGLYTSVVLKYPWADIYRQRTKNSIPGTILQMGNVIHMFSQYYPSGPNNTNDTKSLRLQWFNNCLNQISKLNITSVSFPHYIGCGLARGNWDDYHNCIKEFAKTNPHINVYIVKKE